MKKNYSSINSALCTGLFCLALHSANQTYSQTSEVGSSIFRVTETIAGSKDFAPESALFYNEKIVFSGADDVFGRELSQLELNGEVKTIIDINPGLDDSSPRDFCIYNNYLYFSASNELGNRKLFIYDGYETAMALESIFNTNQGDNPRNLVSYDGNLYYQAYTNELGTHIRKYNGGSTSQPYFSPNNEFNLFLESAFVYKTKLYAVFANTNGDASLYSMDGVNPPQEIISLGEFNSNTSNHFFSELNNTLYFLNSLNSANELWKYDGSNPPEPVQEILNSEITEVSSLTVFNKKLILKAKTPIHGTELWLFDGLVEPSLLADIEIGIEGSEANHFSEFQNKLYFSAYTSAHGTELWSIDSNFNYQLVDDLNAEDNSSNPSNIFEAWGNMYLIANDGSTGFEFWSFCTSITMADIEACSAFTWIDGNTYTESNKTATHTLTNQFGCDSTIMLNLTMGDGNNVHTIYSIDDEGEGTLRHAIQIACNNDTIRFAPSTDGRNIVLSNGELLISKSLIIEGNGQENTIIDGNLETRVFNAEAPLNLSNLTISRGFDTLVGAGINTTSNLLLRNVRIEKCEVIIPENSKIQSEVLPGAAAIKATGDLCEIYGSTISGNTTEQLNLGAALGPICHLGSNDDGVLSIVNSSITGNNTKALIPYNSSVFASNVYLFNSTISGNRIEKVRNQDLSETAGVAVLNNLKLVNSIVWKNTITGVPEIEAGMSDFKSSLVKGMVTESFDGTELPLFVNPLEQGMSPTIDGDYNLKCVSPLIEKGFLGNIEPFIYGDKLTYDVNTDFYLTDANGDNRLLDYDQDEIARADIGAYENQLGNITSTDEQFSCDNFTWIDGENYRSNNNTATHTLIDEKGCKETVTLDLEISDIIAEAEIQGNFIAALDITLEAIQWVDCDNSNEPIEGATGQTFTPTLNGNYAALVKKGECEMLTNCVGFITTGTNDIKMDLLQLYPNPTVGNFQIDLAGLENVTIRIYNGNGKLINEENQISQPVYSHHINEASGIYMLQIESNGASKFVKLIKF